MAQQPQQPPPPQDADAEEAVLGAMMMSRKAIAAVAQELRPPDFYRESHGRIYAAALEIERRGDPVDAITLVGELDRQGLLAEIGGRARVHELARLVPASGNAAHYAKRIRETAVLRRLIRAGGEISKLGWEGQGEVEEIMGKAEEALVEVRRQSPHRTVALTGMDMARMVEARWREPGEQGVSGDVPTPWPTLMGNLVNGALYAVPGYTGHGKSVYCVQQTRSSCEQGHRVGFFTLEMSASQLADRIVSTYGIPYEMVRTGRVDAAYHSRFTRAIGEVARMNVEVIDEPSLTAAGIWGLQRLRQYDLVIVDHLHRFQLGGDPRDEWSMLGREVQTLSVLAREENIPVVMACQLTKEERKGNENPRPRLRDLRGTAVIGHESAVVLAIWQEEDKQTHEATGAAELIVLKNRFGGRGTLYLRFDGNYVRFEPKPGKPGERQAVLAPRADLAANIPRADLLMEEAGQLAGTAAGPQPPTEGI